LKTLANEDPQSWLIPATGCSLKTLRNHIPYRAKQVGFVVRPEWLEGNVGSNKKNSQKKRFPWGLTSLILGFYK